jgi:hypothetical protein
MGHRRMAGLASEVIIAGGQFIRIDIPGRDGPTRLTQYYRPESVYCLTPTTEETARRVAALDDPTPPTLAQLTAGESESGSSEVGHGDANDDGEPW